MFWGETVKATLVVLNGNRRRTFLTMLGIIISIAAVIAINSAGAGAQSLIFNQIKSLGTNLIGVMPGGSEENGPPASVMGIVVTTLTNDDALALNNRASVPHVESVTAYVKGFGTLTWRTTTFDGSFNGVSYTFPDTEKVDIAVGRFFNKEEDGNLSRVIVLGNQVKEDLFGDREAIGEIVRLRKENFRVVGVLEQRGSASFQSYDTQVYLPLRTAQKLLLGINHVSYIRIKVDVAENLNDTMDQIRVLLRERHGITNPVEDDFSVRSQAQALGVLTQITDALRLFITAIAAIGLLVGGIGIMNIMLIAVNERIREIGLRKAVGATYQRVLWQFLAETTFISLFAGLIGIILGVFLAILAAVVIRSLGYDWDLVVSWQSISVSVLFSFLIGLIFGLYPARRAAKLEPVEALRYE